MKNRKPVKKELNLDDLKYVIYCRKSSDESTEKQKNSITDQLNTCLEYAKSKKINLEPCSEITQEFHSASDYTKRRAESQTDYDMRVIEEASPYFYIVEQESAKVPYKRPLRTKLIKLVNAGKIKGILSYAPDRHSRNLVESGVLIQMIDDGLLNVQYTSFTFENNENGRMILGINFVISYNYSDNLSRTIKRGKKGANERGQADGKYKHGYVINDEGYHEPHPQYFDLWKNAFRMKLYENLSDQVIWEYLDINGYKRKYKKGDKETILNRKNLYRVRVDEFYAGILYSGNNEVNLADRNPYFKPLISMDEYGILLDRHLKNNPVSLRNIKPKEENDEIMPFPSQFIRYKDESGLSFNLPNKNRSKDRLLQLQKTNPQATLKDVVQAHQFNYQNSTIKIDGKQLCINGDILIQAVHQYLLKHFVVNEIDYQKYYQYQISEYETVLARNTEKRNKLQLQINVITSQRDQFVRKHLGKERNEIEKSIYNKEIEGFDRRIGNLQQELNQHSSNHRNELLEIDGFLQIIKKLPEVYQKASYVRKRKIVTLLFSNILIDDQKQLIFKAKPGLEGLFTTQLADDETRTRNILLGKEVH